MRLIYIDFDRKIIRIEMDKGGKYRELGLRERLEDILKKYFAVYKPQEYVFEEQCGGKYSARSVQ